MNTFFSFVSEIIRTESFWKSITFVLVILLTSTPLSIFLLRAMKERSEQIRSHIKEALKLRDEARNLLEEYKEKDKGKDIERQDILEKARKNAENLKQEAESQLKKRQEMKEQEILDRVKMIKKNGLKELKDAVLLFSMKTTTSFMIKDEKFRSNTVFFNTSLKELEEVLNDKKEVEKIY